MEQLIESMKVVHATNFAFYLKMHFFHWNVTGPNFPQYHEFFGDLYEEVHGAVDDIAEHIRAIEGFAPGSFQRFMDLSTIQDQVEVVSAQEMFNIALSDNNKVIEVLKAAYKLADAFNELGLANFLQDRMDIHKKHGWMLRSTTPVASLGVAMGMANESESKT
jgi:starvation-inducible DNA-binding protein